MRWWWFFYPSITLSISFMCQVFIRFKCSSMAYDYISPSFLLHQQWKKGLSCFHDDIVHLLVENCRVDFFAAKNMKFLLSEIVFLAFHFIILILFELLLIFMILNHEKNISNKSFASDCYKIFWRHDFLCWVLWNYNVH